MRVKPVDNHAGPVYPGITIVGRPALPVGPTMTVLCMPVSACVALSCDHVPSELLAAPVGLALRMFTVGQMPLYFELYAITRTLRWLFGIVLIVILVAAAGHPLHILGQVHE
jgi:hypothetical protein